jgi:hypothetical protein
MVKYPHSAKSTLKQRQQSSNLTTANFFNDYLKHRCSLEVERNLAFPLTSTPTPTDSSADQLNKNREAMEKIRLAAIAAVKETKDRLEKGNTEELEKLKTQNMEEILVGGKFMSRKRQKGFIKRRSRSCRKVG